MRLSTVGRYALRAMVDLALHVDEGPALCKEIAERQEVSDQYLSQLFLKLRRAGLIKSVRGPGGGYVLASDAAQISAGDVLRAVEETLDPVFCVDEGQELTCHRIDGCPTHWLWARLGYAIHDVLDSTTLADLCGRSCNTTSDTGSVLGHGIVARDGAPVGARRVPLPALDRLEAAYAFQQSIIDGLTEPIMVIATDYQVKLMNRAAREFSSAGADAPESARCYQISHWRETPCEGSEHLCPLQQVRESGHPVTVVHEHYQASGERRLIEVVATPLWGPDDTFQGVIESMRDITEQSQT